MDTDQIDHLLLNYQMLVRRVDHRISHIKKAFPDKIACKKGCDRCCRFLSLFPVEAVALSQAFAALPKDTKSRVIQKIKTEKDACPLLIDGACVLYPARPIICRTHGNPIYMENSGDIRVDFCPDNFKGITSFPKETLLDIEQLNTLLSVINRHFVESVKADPSLLNRVPISDSLFILCP